MSRPMIRDKRTKPEVINNLTFQALYYHYKNLALNLFKWKGLPEGIEERYIERALFDEGKCLFFRDPGMSYMALPCFNGSQLDVYGEPLRWRAQGLNYCKEYDRDDCVLIENNKLRQATHYIVTYYVNKMYEASRTMDTNILTSKIPWFIQCDDKKLLTYKQVVKKIQEENEAAIFGSTGLNLADFNIFPLKVTFLGNDLMDFHRSLEGQLLTALGINNSPIDRNERVNTLETESNNQIIEMNGGNLLEARQRAADRINELYGLNVSVSLRYPNKEVQTDDPDPTAGNEQDHA